MGVAVAAALTGTRPIAEIQFSDFLVLGIDQLGNQAAKMRYMFGGKARCPDRGARVPRAPAPERRRSTARARRPCTATSPG